MTAEEYKAYRVAGRYTQSTLAEVLGISRDTIIRRESGTAPIVAEAEIAIKALVSVPVPSTDLEPDSWPAKPLAVPTGTTLAQVRSYRAERAPIFGGMLKAPKKS